MGRESTSVLPRQAAKKDDDAAVLKTKLSLSTGYALSMFSPSTSNTPYNRPGQKKLLYLDLPSNIPERDPTRRVFRRSVHAPSKPRGHHHIPEHPPGDLKNYVFDSLAAKFSLQRVTLNDISPPLARPEVEHNFLALFPPLRWAELDALSAAVELPFEH